MSLNDAIVFLCVFLFVGFIPFVFWLEYKHANKKIDLKYAKLREELEEEKKNRKQYIVFKLTNGEVKKTNLIDPIIYWGKVMSSTSRSSEVMKGFYEQGYFMCKDYITYPTCNVTQAWAETEVLEETLGG